MDTGAGPDELAAERPLRRDAERNRRRILQAAREVFAERGLAATMDDIARQADVGIGTVYRRFPEKERLIDALFEQRLRDLARAAGEALEAEDPWQGLNDFLMHGVALQATDQGLKELLITSSYGRDRVAEVRKTITPLVSKLLARARDSGKLRDDVSHTDVTLLLLMMGAIADYTRDVAPDTWQRFLTLVVDGLCSGRERATPLPAPPLDEAQLDAAMHAWRPNTLRRPDRSS